MKVIKNIMLVSLLGLMPFAPGNALANHQQITALSVVGGLAGLYALYNYSQADEIQRKQPCVDPIKTELGKLHKDLHSKPIKQAVNNLIDEHKVKEVSTLSSFVQKWDEYCLLSPNYQATDLLRQELYLITRPADEDKELGKENGKLRSTINSMIEDLEYYKGQAVRKQGVATLFTGFSLSCLGFAAWIWYRDQNRG